MTTLRARSVWTAALAATAAAVAWSGTAVALAVAPGVTVLGGDTYDTEFIDGPFYLMAALLSLGLVAVAAAWSWRWAVAGLLASVGALTWGAAVCVRRYADSGWGDGLEVLVYVVPLGVAVAGLVLVTLIPWLRRRGPAVSGAVGR
ncbi:hypothetical protein KDN32_00695 [Nocardioides sp. J2M5]|uniref:hypothetical protein n=1 Tax=Nocardioides palaemonis TaxID=2829810 RepID=UPI001BA977AF|nr:hypothetical protein [Nocardioides palaemonis]MBS2936256.1 hypothetical protein [Nocardioides palaemonis]